MDGKVLQIEAKDIKAKIFQHEIDHLDGILFIDRLSFFQRLKMKNKLEAGNEAGKKILKS
jgi:peptide deformylase